MYSAGAYVVSEPTTSLPLLASLSGSRAAIVSSFAMLVGSNDAAPEPESDELELSEPLSPPQAVSSKADAASVAAARTRRDLRTEYLLRRRGLTSSDSELRD